MSKPDKSLTNRIAYCDATTDPRIQDYLNQYPEIRILVDQKRTGMGHQTATVTAMNRLIELGYVGKFEVLIQYCHNGGKKEFLTALPQIQLALDPEEMKKASAPQLDEPIWVSQQIQIKQIGSVNESIQYLNGGVFIPIEVAQLTIAAGTDLIDFKPFKPGRLVVVQPTGYRRRSYYDIETVGGQLHKVLIDPHNEYVLYAEPRHAPENVNQALYDLINAKNQGACDYISIYGRYDPKNGRPVSPSYIIGRLNRLALSRPLIILHHQHSTHTEPKISDMTSPSSDLSKDLFLYTLRWREQGPLTVMLDLLPDDAFRYVVQSSSFLIAEFSNTYQPREKNGMPYLYKSVWGEAI